MCAATALDPEANEKTESVSIKLSFRVLGWLKKNPFNIFFPLRHMFCYLVASWAVVGLGSGSKAQAQRPRLTWDKTWWMEVTGPNFYKSLRALWNFQNCGQILSSIFNDLAGSKPENLSPFYHEFFLVRIFLRLKFSSVGSTSLCFAASQKIGTVFFLFLSKKSSL